jgi:hypothetical protein
LVPTFVSVVFEIFVSVAIIIGSFGGQPRLIGVGGGSRQLNN